MRAGFSCFQKGMEVTELSNNNYSLDEFWGDIAEVLQGLKIFWVGKEWVNGFGGLNKEFQALASQNSRLIGCIT